MAVVVTTKKSRIVTNAMTKAKQAATEYGNLPVPIHLRNAPTKMMKDLGYGKGYDWQADFKYAEGFLPPELGDISFF